MESSTWKPTGIGDKIILRTVELVPMLLVYKDEVAKWLQKLSYLRSIILLSLDDKLNIAQLMIIYFKFMSITMMSM